MQTRIRAYVGFLTVAACVAGVVLYTTTPSGAPGARAAVFALAGLGLVAQILSHSIGHGASGSIASIPFLAAALVAPSWEATAGITIVAILCETLKRRGPLKTIFNIAQISLAMSISTLVYVSLGGESLVTDSRPSLIPYAMLYFTYLGINTIAVSSAIGISEKSNIVEVWKKNTLSNLANDVLASPLPYFFGWVYVTFGSEWVVGLSLPLLGMREVFKTNRQLEQTNEELLQLMVKAIEARDPYTSGHSRRVAHYSRIVARVLGLSSREIDRVGRAALLHDVGKIHEIYAPILQKPGKLTADEWTVMQTHPLKSEELVRTVSQLKDLLGPIRHHHENWDGSGYPDGVAGEAIPLGARIITFADTIDAMTTDRPYRRAMGGAEVRAELKRLSGKQYDPAICAKLIASPHFAALFDAPAAHRTPVLVPSVFPTKRRTRDVASA